MTTEDRGAAGTYIAYDGLPVLHGTEVKLPLIHPYAPVTSGRFVTPGGGRLSVSTPVKAAHTRITLDHLGCPAQLTDEKNAAFKRLALAAEGHCVRAGCRHGVAYAGGVLRSFEVRTGSIPLTVFVRAALAVELGDFVPVNRLLQETEALVGPIRQEGEEDQASAASSTGGTGWGDADVS